MADALSSYKVRRQPESESTLSALAQAQEFLRQSEALRQDFPLREAKLRQAIDLHDDSLARIDQARYALDDSARRADRAAEGAALAGRQAADLRALVEQKHADLAGATQTALSIRADAEELRQQHHRFCEEVDAARLDLSAFLEDIRLGREEVQSLRAQARPFSPAALPGDAPGSILSTVPNLYPGGPTVLGFLLTQLTATDLTTGISLTNSSLTYTETAAARSGALGLFLNKAKTDTANSHSLIFAVGANPLWEWGVDFNTNNSINGGTGGSYLACFDHTANANAGADVLAFSPAEQDSVATTKKCTKLAFVGDGTGSPKDNTNLVTFSTGAGVDLGGISMTIKSASARDHLTLVNAHATSKRNAINYGGLWLTGTDMAGTGATDYIWRDSANSINRLYIQATASLMAKVGINTTSPLANLYSSVSADASLFDAIQTGLGVGYSTINNRTWQVQYILDASQVELINWFFGTLGSTSTRAVPTATSATLATGIKANQTQGDLISAASGTNTAIVSALSWNSAAGAAKVGFLGATPVVRQVGASAAGIAAITDASAKAAVTAIQNALATLGLITAPA